ncbi:hypothetical protein TNCV_2752451 [Trichonephila clavipes]|nr:hypothetical protein TNCV_2752451 [Trichonephila clavipes]
MPEYMPALQESTPGSSDVSSSETSVVGIQEVVQIKQIAYTDDLKPWIDIRHGLYNIKGSYRQHGEGWLEIGLTGHCQTVKKFCTLGWHIPLRKLCFASIVIYSKTPIHLTRRNFNPPTDLNTWWKLNPIVAL